jgi:hypothetical protein
MNVRFTSAAYRELTEAAEYYEGKQPGLAHSFLSEVEAAAERIERYPEMWAKVPRAFADTSSTGSHSPSSIMRPPRKSRSLPLPICGVILNVGSICFDVGLGEQPG